MSRIVPSNPGKYKKAETASFKPFQPLRFLSVRGIEGHGELRGPWNGRSKTPEMSVFKSVFKYFAFLRKEKCRNSFPPFAMLVLIPFFSGAEAAGPMWTSGTFSSTVHARQGAALSEGRGHGDCGRAGPDREIRYRQSYLLPQTRSSSIRGSGQCCLPGKVPGDT